MLIIMSDCINKLDESDFFVVSVCDGLIETETETETETANKNEIDDADPFFEKNEKTKLP